MSSSSLWVMDKKFNGKEIKEFGNSWLFAPVAWDILFDKYIPKLSYETDRTYLAAAMFDDSVGKRLNNLINNSTIQADRILWELGNQQIFFTKDKKIVADCIKNFLIINKKLVPNGEHSYQRYNDVADAILAIDENKHPYFIMKNTSCDDAVEWWFEKYDEETDDNIPRPLTKVNKFAAEFVVIEENKIAGFISNLAYFELLEGDNHDTKA